MLHWAFDWARELVFDLAFETTTWLTNELTFGLACESVSELVIVLAFDFMCNDATECLAGYLRRILNEFAKMALSGLNGILNQWAQQRCKKYRISTSFPQHPHHMAVSRVHQSSEILLRYNIETNC